MAASLWEYLSLNICMKQPWDIEKAALKSHKSNTEAAICSAIRATVFYELFGILSSPNGRACVL